MHRRAGVTRVLLRDRRRCARRWIEQSTWEALERADGTRDRAELDWDAPELEALEAEGWLADGLPARPVTPVNPPRAEDRPLEVFGDLTLRCDGSGGCCHAYGAVPFRREEAARARELFDVPFTDWRGGEVTHRAPMLVDDRCAFIDGDERCRLHASGAKPFGCALYPATLVDDGVALRVSVAPECACVFESLGATDGAPLWPAGASRSAREAARPLPDPVAMTETRAVSRSDYRAWSDALMAVLAERDDDLAAWLLGLAESLRADPLVDLSHIEPVRALPALRELPTEPDPTRSARSAEVLRWAETARTKLDAWPAASEPERERLYLRALTFGHRLAVEATPLASALLERAARLLLARAMRRSTTHPLASLEAALRHRGLRLLT